ncbi:MAG: hypothetical protein AAFR14_09300, partial [Bacteroidota bacterium]
MTNEDRLRLVFNHLDAGEWEKAHALVDGYPDLPSTHLHAHLHRIEGDEWNARYWYQKAGVPFSELSISKERAKL